MLQNAYLLAKIGFDTAENGPHRFQKSAEWDTGETLPALDMQRGVSSEARGSHGGVPLSSDGAGECLAFRLQ